MDMISLRDQTFFCCSDVVLLCFINSHLNNLQKDFTFLTVKYIYLYLFLNHNKN